MGFPLPRRALALLYIYHTLTMKDRPCPQAMVLLFGWAGEVMYKQGATQDAVGRRHMHPTVEGSRRQPGARRATDGVLEAVTPSPPSAPDVGQEQSNVCYYDLFVDRFLLAWFDHVLIFQSWWLL